MIHSPGLAPFFNFYSSDLHLNESAFISSEQPKVITLILCHVRFVIQSSERSGFTMGKDNILQKILQMSLIPVEQKIQQRPGWTIKYTFHIQWKGHISKVCISVKASRKENPTSPVIQCQRNIHLFLFLLKCVRRIKHSLCVSPEIDKQPVQDAPRPSPQRQLGQAPAHASASRNPLRTSGSR